MKALITGSTGFVGRHLTKELEDNGYEVMGVDRFGRRLKSFEMNVLDYEAVRSTLEKYRPDVIYHLAAIAYVPASWQDPHLVFKVNTLGSLNLFNAVRSTGFDIKIHIAGSSEEYGLVEKDELPITEDNPLRPLSPYAVSKIAMDMLGYQYFKSYGLKIYRTRAFNHEGYGRGPAYMTSTFAKQIAEIEADLKPPVLKHGNLTAKRDITDVRDMVVAYRLATEKCKPGEVYNIGSGKTYSVRKVLDTLLSMSTRKIKLELDPERMRPSDVPVLQCDPTKFQKATGWRPKYKLEDTLEESLRYWRERTNGKR